MTKIKRGEFNAMGHGAGSLGQRDCGTVFIFDVRGNLPLLSLPLFFCPLTSIIPHEYLYLCVIVRDLQLEALFGHSSCPPRALL